MKRALEEAGCVSGRYEKEEKENNDWRALWTKFLQSLLNIPEPKSPK